MPSDTDRIVNLVRRRTSANERSIRDDVQQLKQYGIDDESILKTLTLKYGRSTEPSLLDVPAVTLIRAGLLIDGGIEDPRSLMEASPDEVVGADIGSKSLAKAVIEGAAILLDESPVLDTLRDEAGINEKRLVTELQRIIADGIPLSEAVDDIVSISNEDPSVLDISGLNIRAAYNLHQEGYETVEDIAAATVSELADIRYVGESTAKTAITAAQEELESSDSDPDTGEMGNQKNTESGSEGVSKSFEQRLLLIGSARPNLHDGEVSGIRIRATLENEGFDLSEFDAAVYSGFVQPSPHHEKLDPSGCFDELHDQFEALASKISVYYITGDYGHGDPLEGIYESDEYAPGSRIDPFVTAQSDALTYIPIHDTVDHGEIQLTQNPAIASTETNCLLVTPDLYPELWTNHEALAYVAGGQLPGRYIEDSIAPMYAMENVGPMRPDAAGGIHTVTLTDDGITSHNFLPLGDSDLTSCPDHIDRGLQFSHSESGCFFCFNEAEYFEEWLRAGARKARNDRRRFDLESLVEYIADSAQFTAEQEEEFRDYAAQRIREDFFAINDTGPTIDAQRSIDSPLLPDPRDVLDRASLIASELLRLQPHDRVPYFRQFDVPDVGTTRSRDFSEVAPPIPDDMVAGHEDLDEAAFKRGELGGEWLLFPKRQMLGTIWERTLELVSDGQLYDAQVGTAWHQDARGSRSKHYYLGIAVPNYFDETDIHRVGELITTEDIVGDDAPFFFKPLLYTQLGIHRYNAQEYGLESPTRYTLKALRKLAR